MIGSGRAMAIRVAEDLCACMQERGRARTLRQTVGCIHKSRPCTREPLLERLEYRERIEMLHTGNTRTHTHTQARALRSVSRTPHAQVGRRAARAGDDSSAALLTDVSRPVRVKAADARRPRKDRSLSGEVLRLTHVCGSCRLAGVGLLRDHTTKANRRLDKTTAEQPATSSIARERSQVLG